MPALLHVALRVPKSLTRQSSGGLKAVFPEGASAIRGSPIAVRQWAPTPTIVAKEATSSSLVNTAIQKPSNEVIGGAVVGTFVGVTLIILFLLCCCYTERGGSDTSTTSSSSSASEPQPGNTKPPPPPAAVSVLPSGPGPPPPPPVLAQPTSGGPPPPPPPPPAAHIAVKEKPTQKYRDSAPPRLALVNGELAKVKKIPLKVKRPRPPRRPGPHGVPTDHISVASEDRRRPPRVSFH